MSLLDVAARLTAAFAAGLFLGAERELRGHPAGMRTHVLVAVGAAMFTLAGAYGFADPHGAAHFDPTRVAAQVASGVGFIGAGTILREGRSVRGLTTAATLWLGASLGVAAGAGMFPEVGIGTVLILVALIGLRWVRAGPSRSGHAITVDVEYRLGSGTLGPLLTVVKSSGSRIEQIDVHDQVAEETRRLTLQLQLPRRMHVATLMDLLGAVPNLHRLTVLGNDPA